MNLVEKKKQLENNLYDAIMENSSSQVSSAIKAGADPNENIKEKSPLYWAIALKKFNAAKELLTHNAMDNDKTLISKAFNGASGDINLVLMLIRKGANITEFMNDVNLILLLSHSKIINTDKQLELMQEFLNHGYNINNFWKIIHKARTKIQKQIIEFLIKNGIDVNYKVESIRSGQYWSPLVILIDKNDMELVKYLLAHGADINQKVKTGYPKILTPLSYALQRGLTPMAEFLLQHGAKAD